MAGAREKSTALVRRALEADAAKDFARAVALAAEAAAADAADAEAWRLLGVFQEKVGDYGAAIEAYERAMSLGANEVDIARDIARLASLMNLPGLAENFLLRAHRQDPGSLEVVNDLAYAYCAQSKFTAAIDLLRATLMENPGSAMLWNTLGCVLYEQGEAGQSLVFFDEAIRLQPDFHNALYNRSHARKAVGDAAGAIEDCDRAIRLGADSRTLEATYRHARSTHLLTAGEVGAGWDAYGVRNEDAYAEYVRHDLKGLPWTPGQPLAGRRVLVVGEQGVGDEILFASLLAEIAEEIGPSGRLILAVDPRLAPMVQRSFATAKVVTYETRWEGPQAVRSVPAAGGYDVWARMGDFLASHRRSVADFPNRPEGFLKADPAQVEHWRKVLGALGPQPKVGVIWQSLIMTAQRQRYYAPLELWEPIFRTPGVTFINLQLGDYEAPLKAMAGLTGADIHTLPGLDLRQDLDGIAALSSALDLVIGPATATTNIAAAVGAPTWFMTTPDAWPRLGTPALPWYSQVRAFSGQQSYDWAAVTAEVAAALRNRA